MCCRRLLCVRVREDDQEMKQPYTTHQPVAHDGRDTEHWQLHDIKSNEVEQTDVFSSTRWLHDDD